jgi:hypothetical protein
MEGQMVSQELCDWWRNSRELSTLNREVIRCWCFEEQDCLLSQTLRSARKI